MTEAISSDFIDISICSRFALDRLAAWSQLKVCLESLLVLPSSIRTAAKSSPVRCLVRPQNFYHDPWATSPTTILKSGVKRISYQQDDLVEKED